MFLLTYCRRRLCHSVTQTFQHRTIRMSYLRMVSPLKHTSQPVVFHSLWFNPFLNASTVWQLVHLRLVRAKKGLGGCGKLANFADRSNYQHEKLTHQWVDKLPPPIIFFSCCSRSMHLLGTDQNFLHALEHHPLTHTHNRFTALFPWLSG